MEVVLESKDFVTKLDQYTSHIAKRRDGESDLMHSGLKYSYLTKPKFQSLHLEEIKCGW